MSEDAFISTFHAFCFRLLEAHPEALGLSGSSQLIEPLPAQLLLHQLIQEIQEGDWADMAPALAAAELSETLPSNLFQL